MLAWSHRPCIKTTKPDNWDMEYNVSFSIQCILFPTAQYSDSGTWTCPACTCNPACDIVMEVLLHAPRKLQASGVSGHPASASPTSTRGRIMKIPSTDAALAFSSLSSGSTRGMRRYPPCLVSDRDAEMRARVIHPPSLMTFLGFLTYPLVLLQAWRCPPSQAFRWHSAEQYLQRQHQQQEAWKMLECAATLALAAADANTMTANTSVGMERCDQAYAWDTSALHIVYKHLHVPTKSLKSSKLGVSQHASAGLAPSSRI